MRIGFVGDVVGKPGRTILKEHLQRLKFRERLDVVIANGENSSHGFGMTADSIGELLDSGIDVITGGNHSWDKKEILALLQSDLPILRPLNYPQTAPGSGIGIYQIGNDSLAVLNVMGHFAMPLVDNPFTLALAAVKTLHEQGIRHIFVDFHAEATSEKRAMFWLLSGHVSAVIGTHTHIGTDDLEIANGTLGLSDAGACGCMFANVSRAESRGHYKSRQNAPKFCRLSCMKQTAKDAVFWDIKSALSIPMNPKSSCKPILMINIILMFCMVAKTIQRATLQEQQAYRQIRLNF